jgi:hypothetical protein
MNIVKFNLKSFTTRLSIVDVGGGYIYIINNDHLHAYHRTHYLVKISLK